MNVLMVSDFNGASIGGVQSSLRAQTDELRNQGHTVVLLCPAEDQQYGQNNDDMFLVPSIRLFRPNNHAVACPLRYSVEALAKDLGAVTKFDIVHAQTTGILGAQARQIADSLKIPLVQTMHGRDDVFIEQTTRFPLLTASGIFVLDRFLVRGRKKFHFGHLSLASRMMWDTMLNRAVRADAVTIPSRHFAEKFISNGLDAEKVTVISNGIPDEVINDIERSQKNASSPLSIMWAGRLSSEKRPELAIRAIAQMENCTLDIYGDGPIMNTCKQLIDDLGIASRVRMHGAYNPRHIYRLMQKHDLLLYTSYQFDNQPMVLLEAVVASLPVVYCDPDLTECLPSGGGILTASPTVESLRDSIESLQNNPKKLRALRQQLIDKRDTVRQSIHTKKMVELYNKSIGFKTA